ncbi:MAG: SufE family protein [Hyphomicrobiaceae bacterium]
MMLDQIREDFELLDEWEDRYRYVIELGRKLPAFPEDLRTDANKVRGCASQVWLASRVEGAGDASPRMHFEGDSDAHIVKGLVAILLSIYDGKSPQQILELDAQQQFADLGLSQHLTQQRSNGLASMVARIRADATVAAAA